jgi:dipeptidyl aminopeptidase/acylaminoacyl peptidase
MALWDRFVVLTLWPLVLAGCQGPSELKGEPALVAPAQPFGAGETHATGGALPGSAQVSHPFSVEDMLAMERLSDPQVSPDGRWVAYVVRTTDLEANRGRTDVELAPLDGPASAIRRLTTHPDADHSPRWLADGKSLLFLSTRSGSSQVWRLAIGGGEATQVTDFPLDVENLQLFEDGERIAFTMEVYPDAATLQETVQRDKEREESQVQARLYDSLLFRHWDTWEDGKRSHVFVWSLAQKGDPIDLMRGMNADSPTRPFGGAEEIALAPSCAEIVFAAKDEGASAAWSTNVDLWRVPADGSRPPERLTAANQAQDNVPCFSPDGRSLAWLAMSHPGYESDRQRVMLLDLASGVRRSLADAWDRSPADLAWAADGKSLLATADDVGQHPLFAIDVATGAVTKLVEQGYCASPVSAGGHILFLHDHLHAPAELALVRSDGAGMRYVTERNAERVRAARMGDFEQFHFAGAKGETVHGFVVKPVDFDPAKQYPVALLIHGGPQGSLGNHFQYRWNAQALAGAGYAAVMIDFHGSTGYGQAFTDSIRMDWGGAPFEDLMLGLDHALAAYPFLDAERVAALGASYGGFMINWIAGNTDRFRCLVNHDGNLDEQMAYFNTEELWFPEWDHGGVPWDDAEHFERHNPINLVKNWKTPMLVIHGALDYRVVDTQGLSTFTALQRRGIPSQLLYFPDENHWVLKPLNSRVWYQTVIGWLDRWLQDASG